MPGPSVPNHNPPDQCCRGRIGASLSEARDDPRNRRGSSAGVFHRPFDTRRGGSSGQKATPSNHDRYVPGTDDIYGEVVDQPLPHMDPLKASNDLDEGLPVATRSAEPNRPATLHLQGDGF